MSNLGQAGEPPETAERNNWHEIWITDHSGKKFWNTSASSLGTQAELRNMQRRLDQIMKNGGYMPEIDSTTAGIMLDGKPFGTREMSDDEILPELGMGLLTA